jgi:hypothetical protein
MDGELKVIEKVVTIKNPPGAQFETQVDGKPRSYRDLRAVAIESAKFLKRLNPHSEVAVRDLQSGTTSRSTSQNRSLSTSRRGATNDLPNAKAERVVAPGHTIEVDRVRSTGAVRKGIAGRTK